MGTLVNSEDPDEMLHTAAFIQISALFAKVKLHQDSGINAFGLSKYTMGSPILIVSICMGKSIRVQRVKLTSAFDRGGEALFLLDLSPASKTMHLKMMSDEVICCK